MNTGNLTYRLNRKALCIVLIFIIAATMYNLWFTFHKQKTEATNQLQGITNFLVRELPNESFVAIAARLGVQGQALDAQVIAINKEIQPILENIFIPNKAVMFGIYSRYHQRIVAIDSNFDSALLTSISNEMVVAFEQMYQDSRSQLEEDENSLIRDGHRILSYRIPIRHEGQVIGHAFANISLSNFHTEFWRSAVNALGGGALAILLVIALFQEAFVRLKKDLRLFAEAIVQGRARKFESTIPELTPVLQYISEQTENMARLDRLNTVGEMAASIGHEVRNPMTTVRGFLQHMSTKEKFQDSKEYFVLMIDELDRANSIITTFLSLAKNKAMNFKRICINNVITEIAPLMEADALRYNCLLAFDLKPLPKLMIDESSLRQLLLNLVRNSIEAMPQGGIIIISTIDGNDKVVLSVQDNGVGISPEAIGNLGTPFVTTKENGTGLGLAVCYRIAQRHGANVSVKSELGKGTQFTIEFMHMTKDG